MEQMYQKYMNVSKIKITGIDNKYVNHGKVNDLKARNNLDIDYIVNDIEKYFEK